MRRWRALVAVCGVAWSMATAAADLDDVLLGARLDGNAYVDIAVVRTSGLCYNAHQSPANGVQIIDGDARGARPRLHGASISKLFTAVVIMQLRDEGRLALQDPLSKYVPEFAGSPILLEHLLTHTSGLRDRQRAAGRSTAVQVDAYIHQLSRQRLANAPGAKWVYADAGFNLLGRVIETVTGQAFAQVMRHRVLEPLGMTGSDFELSRIPAADRMSATDKRGHRLAHPWDLAFLPSSGLQTDARDLAKFGGRILAVESAALDGGMLRAQTLREMTAARVATQWSGISQGYGWQLQAAGSGAVWRHAGGEAGFESLLTLYPVEGFGVVVMGNREDWPRFEIAAAVAAQVAAAHARNKERCHST
jgi:CubicO group peptidase (beta-lactamase class C family)